MFDARDHDKPHPGVTLPGNEPPRRSRPRRWWLAALALVVVFAVVGEVFINRDPDERDAVRSADGPPADASAPAGTDGSDTEAGDTEAGDTEAGDAEAGPELARGKVGRRVLTIRIPQESTRWAETPVSAVGHTGKISEEAGGVTVAVFHAPAGDRDAECPERIPTQKQSEQGWFPLVTANVYGAGPFRAAGSQPSPTEPGIYRVCGYIEPFASGGSRGRTLVTTGSMPLADAKMPETEFDADTGLLDPGVYAARGDDVAGAPPGTEVEFRVVAGGAGQRTVQFIAVTNLPTGDCTPAGKPKRADLLADTPEIADLGVLAEATMQGDVALTGGPLGRRTYFGQIGIRSIYPGCPGGHVAFVASRVSGGATPLKDRLKQAAVG